MGMEMRPRQKREKLGGDLNKKQERMKLVSSLRLKNFNAEETSILISGFLAMDADNDGFLSTAEAFIYMRAMGWVWPDERLVEAFVLAASGGAVKYDEKTGLVLGRKHPRAPQRAEEALDH